MPPTTSSCYSNHRLIYAQNDLSIERNQITSFFLIFSDTVTSFPGAGSLLSKWKLKKKTISQTPRPASQPRVVFILLITVRTLLIEMSSGDDRENDRSAIVLYGSETGNAQEVAEELGRLAERLHFSTHVAELNEVKAVCKSIPVL